MSVKRLISRTSQATGAPAWLRILAAVGLAVGAYIHAKLAGDYGIGLPSSFTSDMPLGTLFVAQAAVGFVVAVWLAASDSFRAWLAVLVVSGGSFVAVVASRYLTVPGFGPIPSLYEPVWTEPAVISAVAEGVSAAACVVALALYGRRHLR